jgi:hypothetical protein
MIETSTAPVAPARLAQVYDLSYGRILERVSCLVQQRELAFDLTRQTLLNAMRAMMRPGAENWYYDVKA